MIFSRRFSNSRGFSLMELLIVISILFILGAIATPTLFRAIRTYQLEASGRQVANMVLQARYEAMQRNRRVCAVFQRVGNEGRYGLDLFGADPEPCDDPLPTLDASEPFTVTNNIVNWFFNDTPLLPPMNGLPAGYNTPNTTIVAPPRFRIVFSPRGTVVAQTVAGGAWQMTTRVQAITLLRNVPNDFDAVLVTVTPVGRIKLYRWRVNRATWDEM